MNAMKKFLLAALAALCVALGAAAQHWGVRPKLLNQQAWSMIVIPDPQCYTNYKANQPIINLMTAWIASNVDSLNIKTALCTGDLVDRNNTPVANRKNGDQTSTQMWQAISSAFANLDGVLPYVVCTGNHDYGFTKTSENRQSQMGKYFTSDRNPCWQKSLVSVCHNAYDEPTLENAAFEIETNSQWGRLLVLSLEFTPRDTVLRWAKALVDKPRYRDARVIVLTHSYIDKHGKWKQRERYPLCQQPDANCGEQIWQKLVYPSHNICMVVCGHVCSIAPYKDNVAFSYARNQSGRRVAQMMFNAQTADGYWQGNGGDGWLRILEFQPDGHTINVRTFSPLFAASGLTCDHAWRTDDYDQFTIDLGTE